MQVTVNSDHNITGDESVTARVEAILADSIERFANRITRVEAFLSDANSSKHGARDKRCVLEARIAGAQSVVASNEAPTVLEAIEGAANKLERVLEHTLGKQEARSGRSPREQDVATADELRELEKWERDRDSRESKHPR
jgi:ribosome-associated translation inhibitor RaiA